MQLNPKAPFDLVRTLRFILSPPGLQNGRPFEPLLDHLVDGEYRRLADVGGRLVLYGVRQRGRGTLDFRIVQGEANVSTAAPVSLLVRRQFSLDLDIKPFYRLAETDPVLSRLTQHFHGMRVPQAPGVFETLISAILEQQVNLSFAHKVKKALVARYGRSCEYGGYLYHCFPEPAVLAATTPADLLTLQISGPKARYIIAISRAICDGTLDLEGLRQLEAADAAGRLMALKGVGAWTAHYVGMRALGYLDCLPSADVGLQKAIGFFYGLRRQPTSTVVERRARAWAGWRSYATFYLWLTFWEEVEWRKNLRNQIRTKS